MSHHGAPLWYELTTPDLAASAAFYGPLLGWSVADSGMEGVGTYHIAETSSGMVAGMMNPVAPEVPPNWLVYWGADDIDTTVAAMLADGAMILAGPMDVPGVGRIAVLADPQGAAFGLLQPPAGMAPPGDVRPFAQRPGHAQWHELMTSDPAAALAFYTRHLGWGASTAMDMGPMGTYQIVARDGGDVAGIMGSGGAPSGWMPVFGRDGITAAATEIPSAGGTILWGPAEIPGGSHAVTFRDPQGAHAVLVGAA